jgi:hypothetical protein
MSTNRPEVATTHLRSHDDGGACGDAFSRRRALYSCCAKDVREGEARARRAAGRALRTRRSRTRVSASSTWFTVGTQRRRRASRNPDMHPPRSESPVYAGLSLSQQVFGGPLTDAGPGRRPPAVATIPPCPRRGSRTPDRGSGQSPTAGSSSMPATLSGGSPNREAPGARSRTNTATARSSSTSSASHHRLRAGTDEPVPRRGEPGGDRGSSTRSQAPARLRA